MSTETTPPKVFISYSWTSDEYADWVRELAERLVKQSSIDVVLDRWDLKPGQDKFDFMEGMVKDPSVQKVLVICDKRYAERADQRKGGVGTESTMLSSKVYNDAKQEKFIPVVTERNPDGEPYLPIFLEARMYIDLSDPRRFEAGYEELVRNIGGKPLYVKPALGQGQSFMAEKKGPTPTTTYAKRAFEDALLHDKRHATGLAKDYLDAVLVELKSLRVDAKEVEKEKYASTMMERLEQWIPFRDEFVEFLRFMTQYGSDSRLQDLLPRFFEKSLSLSTPRYSDQINEHINFIIHELFLYTIAVLLQEENFSGAATLLDAQYRNEEGEFYRFSTFAHLKTEYLGRAAQTTWEGRYRETAILWKLIQDRSSNPSVPFTSVRETDFLLLVRFVLEGRGKKFNISGLLSWFPVTFEWDYLSENSSEFPIFKRAISRRYFERFKAVLGVENKEDLIERWNDAFPPPTDEGIYDRGFIRRETIKAIVSIDKIGTS